MTSPALLRRYHEALSRALFTHDLVNTNAHFRLDLHMQNTDETRRLYGAHVARVAGRGSPAECDDLLNQLLQGRG